MGQEHGSLPSPRQVSGKKTRGAGCPEDVFFVAAFAGDHGSFAGQVQVFHIEREDFPGPGGCFVQHPPQGLFSQVYVSSGPEFFEVLVGDGFGLVAGFPAPYYQRHRIMVYPSVALTVGHERLEGGDPGVPSRGLRRSPPLLKYVEEVAGVQLVNAKIQAKVLGHGRERLPIRPASVSRELLVREECLHSRPQVRCSPVVGQGHDPAVHGANLLL